MANLLKELTSAIHPRTGCPCGKFLLANSFGIEYTCECGFTVSMLSLLNSNSPARMIHEKYRKFKQSQQDPMNQLPAYYREK